MNIIETDLPEVLVLEPKVFGDARGFFMESYNQRTFKQLGLPTHFVQDNHSRSQRGVLRGIHYQIKHPQGKLVRVLNARYLMWQWICVRTRRISGAGWVWS